MSRGGFHTHYSQRTSHQLNDGHLYLFNTVAVKNWLLLRYVIFSNILDSHFPFTEDNMDILKHFVDFMTSNMRWRMPFLSLTIELIIHILKLVFHWNVVSMSHVHYFLWLAQILRVCLCEIMWTSATYFLALSWQVTCHWRITNKMTLRWKYSRLCSSHVVVAPVSILTT
jgi:hypothetical protein